MARPKKEGKEKCIRQNISMDPVQLERLIRYCQQRSRWGGFVLVFKDSSGDLFNG